MRMQAAESVDMLNGYAAMSISRRATSITLALARVVVDWGRDQDGAQNRRSRNRVQCQLQLPFTTATSAPAVVMSCARPDRASSCSLPASVPLRSTVVFAFSRFLPLWAGTFAPRAVTSVSR
jgi:hypothetical protein